MKKALCTVVALCVMGVVNAETLKYEPATVRLAGTFVSGEGEMSDEGKVTFPAIKLKVPVRVEASPEDEINEAEESVSVMQLILNKKEMNQYKALKGQQVLVTGKLTHAITGHHYTKVLLDVIEIEKNSCK